MLNESADLLNDADHISTAVPATEAVSKIKQAASNLKEHAAQITSLKDEATINGAKSRAKSLASEVRHDVTDAAADIARTIAHVELPAPIEGWQELLGGLFVPAPRWPSEHLTLAALLSRARPAALLVLGVTILFIGVAVVLLVVLPVVVPLAVLLAPVAALVGGAALLRRQQAAAAPPPPSPPPPADWREAPDEAFADPAQRAEMKAEILSNVRAALARRRRLQRLRGVAHLARRLRLRHPGGGARRRPQGARAPRAAVREAHDARRRLGGRGRRRLPLRRYKADELFAHRAAAVWAAGAAGARRIAADARQQLVLGAQVALRRLARRGASPASRAAPVPASIRDTSSRR